MADEMLDFMVENPDAIKPDFLIKTLDILESKHIE